MKNILFLFLCALALTACGPDGEKSKGKTIVETQNFQSFETCKAHLAERFNGNVDIKTRNPASVYPNFLMEQGILGNGDQILYICFPAKRERGSFTYNAVTRHVKATNAAKDHR